MIEAEILSPTSVNKIVLSFSLSVHNMFHQFIERFLELKVLSLACQCRGIGLIREIQVPLILGKI